MNLSDWIQPAILAVLATTVIVAVLHLRTQNRPPQGQRRGCSPLDVLARKQCRARDVSVGSREPKVPKRGWHRYRQLLRRCRPLSDLALRKRRSAPARCGVAEGRPLPGGAADPGAA